VSASPTTGGPPIQNITVRHNPGGDVVYSGASGGSFTVTFTTGGTHTLTATATDTSGTTGSATAVITVGNPEATLTASGPGLNCSGFPTMTCTGLAAGTNVTFSANITSAGVTGVLYQWNWGDGSPSETTTSRFNSHVYAAAGSYVPQVTITTSGGGTASQILFLRP
jgi:PKD repeat protein